MFSRCIPLYCSMFRGLDALDDLEWIQLRVPRRLVRDRMDPFHSMTEGEFLSRFRLTKEATRDLIEQLHLRLPQTESNRGKDQLCCNILFILLLEHITVYNIYLYLSIYIYRQIDR